MLTSTQDIILSTPNEMHRFIQETSSILLSSKSKQNLKSIHSLQISFDETKYDEGTFINTVGSKPFIRGIWGFIAGTMQLTSFERKKMSYNILTPSIAIYMPQSPKMIALPRGQYFYVFYANNAEGRHKAIDIKFGDKMMKKFKILTRPNGYGSWDPENPTFCSKKQEQTGVCYGDASCCNSFQNILSVSNGDNSCRRVLLCPKGIFKVDLYDYDSSAAHDGLRGLEIYGAEYFKGDRKIKERRLLFQTPKETNYVCPDDSIHVQLDCPLTSNLVDSKDGGDEFHECPFCTSSKHQVRILYQMEHDKNLKFKVGGDCPNINKEELISFQFIKPGYLGKMFDYQTCCIKRIKKAASYSNGAYSYLPLDKVETMEIEESVIKEEEEEEKDKDKEVEQKKKENNKVVESIDNQKEREELRKANQTGNEQRKQTRKNKNYGSFGFNTNMSMIIGIIITIIMLITSSYILFG